MQNNAFVDKDIVLYLLNRSENLRFICVGKKGSKVNMLVLFVSTMHRGSMVRVPDK